VVTNIMKPRFTKRLPEGERRRSILDAALAVLSSEGYSGMTTARVARKVGVAEPILYRHFSSKRDILRTLLDEIIARMMAAFQELIEGETDPVAALHRICRAYPELSRRYGREFRIINESVFEARDPETRATLSRHYDAYRVFLKALIKKGQRAGSLRKDIPAEVGAWHMIHCALGFLMMQEVRKHGQSPKDQAGLADATLAGLLKVP
jgi:AcrR family transcriptional regulator